MPRNALYVVLLLIIGANVAYVGFLADPEATMPIELQATLYGSIGLAVVGFLLTLMIRSGAAASEGSGVPVAKESPAKPVPAKKQKAEKPAPPKPAQSEAITLLAALQREARFVDFLQESLDGFDDAQIGAVAREVHRDAGQVVTRLFAVAPLLDEEEAAEVEVAAGFDPGAYRLTGNVTGDGPYKGQLVHHGWKATKCDVPKWTGSKDAAMIVAPAEVEL